MEQQRATANTFHFRASRRLLKGWFRTTPILVCNIFDASGFLVDEVRVPCPKNKDDFEIRIKEVKAGMLERRNILCSTWSPGHGL